jgi:hypothetical protein
MSFGKVNNITELILGSSKYCWGVVLLLFLHLLLRCIYMIGACVSEPGLCCGACEGRQWEGLCHVYVRVWVRLGIELQHQDRIWVWSKEWAGETIKSVYWTLIALQIFWVGTVKYEGWKVTFKLIVCCILGTTGIHDTYWWLPVPVRLEDKRDLRAVRKGRVSQRYTMCTEQWAGECNHGPEDSRCDEGKMCEDVGSIT